MGQMTLGINNLRKFIKLSALNARNARSFWLLVFASIPIQSFANGVICEDATGRTFRAASAPSFPDVSCRSISESVAPDASTTWADNEEELGISIEIPRAPHAQRTSVATRNTNTTADGPVGTRMSSSVRASYIPAAQGSDVSSSLSGSTAEIVTEVAVKYGHDERLLHSIIYVESRGNSGAISPKGAIGLMQIMPATGARFGVSQPKQMLRDPKTNIQVGARYLSELKKMFNGDLRLVLAAYNAGEGSVMRYGNRIPPFAETQDYVRSVLARYLALNQCKAREGSCTRQEVAIAR